MPLDQTKSLSLIASYAFAAEHGLGAEAQQIRALPVRSKVRRGYFVELFEKHNLLPTFCAQHWSYSASQEGQRMLARYRKLKAQHAAGADEGGPDVDEQEVLDEFQEFALEAHLRDFLADNLDRVEAGLKLFTSPTQKGVEFAVDNGRIDLLAIDKEAKFVVIELKLSRGRSKALGQLLYYMSWVDKHLGKGPCRGYIIANDISDELRVAVSRAPGIQLAEYYMSFAIKPVAS